MLCTLGTVGVNADINMIPNSILYRCKRDWYCCYTGTPARPETRHGSDQGTYIHIDTYTLKKTQYLFILKHTLSVSSSGSVWVCTDDCSWGSERYSQSPATVILPFFLPFCFSLPWLYINSDPISEKIYVLKKLFCL